MSLEHELRALLEAEEIGPAQFQHLITNLQTTDYLGAPARIIKLMRQLGDRVQCGKLP